MGPLPLLLNTFERSRKFARATSAVLRCCGGIDEIDRQPRSYCICGVNRKKTIYGVRNADVHRTLLSCQAMLGMGYYKLVIPLTRKARSYTANPNKALDSLRRQCEKHICNERNRDVSDGQGLSLCISPVSILWPSPVPVSHLYADVHCSLARQK